MTLQVQILSLLKMLAPQDPEMTKIRVGSCGDGGYVLPDDLNFIDNVLSIGIGNEDSFDYFFADKKIPVTQYDHTVDGAVHSHEFYKFNKISWDSVDADNSRTLETMMQLGNLKLSCNGILKFDVEGAEWECIPKINPDLLKHFRIIVCELHGLTSVNNNEHREIVRKTLEILTSNHTVVHLHANNCCGISVIEGIPIPAVVEITLLRNDRSKFTPTKSTIPGPLDFPNMADRPELFWNYF